MGDGIWILVERTVRMCVMVAATACCCCTDLGFTWTWNWMTEKLPAKTLDPEGFRFSCIFVFGSKGFRIFVLARNIDSSHNRSRLHSASSIPWPWCGNNSRVQHHGRISIIVDAIISIYRERGCILPSREAKTTGDVGDFVV